MDEINKAIREIKNLKNMQDEIQMQIDALTDKVKAFLLETKQEVYFGGDCKVTWQPVTSNRFDSSAFRLANPDLYRKYLKVSTVRRFTVS
jgi:predicted phage-related endonuclease